MTVPVGVPEPCEVTVAVNVTNCSKAEGFGEDVSVVTVLASAAYVNLNTVPAPEVPPISVVPYRLPCASCINPATGAAPSGAPAKL